MPPPGSDTTPPTLRSVSLTNRRFRLPGRRGRTRVGTTFRYRLSEAATLTIVIERALPGRKLGKRCVAPTRPLRKKPKCTRYVRQGGLTRRSAAGSTSVAFNGKLGGRKLAPGRYRATLVATDAARNRSRPARLTFTVARR